MRRSRAAWLLLSLCLLAGSAPRPATAESPAETAEDVLNALLTGLLGFTEASGPEFQRQVAEVGGIPFRSEVPLDFMSRQDLARFLHELLETEYPEARARLDQRLLVAFDLLSPEADLRAIRRRLLEDNVVGFYDERPGRKRLYAVSSDRRLTPANQLVLSHELRHALQDQYVDVQAALPDAFSDFDDRKLAALALFEGDAMLVMERYLASRVSPRPGVEEETPRRLDAGLPAGTGILGEDVPAVVRDQLVVPYLAGRDLAAALHRGGGWERIREAWRHPPESTEQVLHPEKYLEREAPRRALVPLTPEGGRLLAEGVLGESQIRTLLGEGAEEAAAGWGGDGYRLWEVRGRTLLAWRTVWDRAEDAEEFHRALVRRFVGRHGERATAGRYRLFGEPRRFAIAATPGVVDLLSADDPRLLDRATGTP